MVDLFPALSLGGVALIGLMRRMQPAAPIRWAVVATLGLTLFLYLSGHLHAWLPDEIGLPVYGLVLALAMVVIVWNRWDLKSR